MADDLCEQRTVECQEMAVTLRGNTTSDDLRMGVGLREFVKESNRIEGIRRAPTTWEITAHDELLALNRLDSRTMEEFVKCIQPGAKIRTQIGMNVRVGSYLPPAGNPDMRQDLDVLLMMAYEGHETPYEIHCRYERLHPFMDGNGRSGRAVWAWHMLRQGQDPFGLPFLHRWYYQSLDSSRT